MMKTKAKAKRPVTENDTNWSLGICKEFSSILQAIDFDKGLVHTRCSAGVFPVATIPERTMCSRFTRRVDDA
jgi:hypothetical protein